MNVKGHKTHVAECDICGKKFEAKANNAKYCEKCRIIALNRYYKKESYKETKRRRKEMTKKFAALVDKPVNLDIGKLVGTKVIRSAKKKPAGVSDVRWRIELRRRQASEYYSQFGVEA